MITLQVLWNRNRINAHHRAVNSGKHDGGQLTTVYPGGSFMGYSFDELAAMGSGEHDLEDRDPYDFRNTGREPSYESRWRAEIARFEGVLFGYQVGAYTTLEVLAFAREVDAAAADR